MMNGHTAATLSSESRVLASKEAGALRETWQVRLLATAHGRMGAIAVTMLAHTYYEAMDVLLRVVFPGIVIKPPCFAGTASITQDGRVICNMLDRDGDLIIGVQIFASEAAFIYAWRRLADRLKLSDLDRMAMFDAVQNWVTADHRIMLSGEKVA
jgi:hypothetical protein